MAAVSFILGFFLVLGFGLSVFGTFNLLSAFGISNIYPSLYSGGSVEVDGDSTTGWICLSIGIFLVLSAMTIKRKYNIKLP